MPVFSASLTSVAFDLRDGTLDPRELLETLASQFEDREDQIKAFVPEVDRFDRLRRDLEALEARFPDPARWPPLFGVPVGIKDVFRTDGFPTRAGSRVPPDVLIGREAEVVSRLRAAGALLVGKTNTTEFAYFAPGPTRNPRALDHTPGGSSSGSAAAVAAGLVPLAIGTQTIGSVNRPAAFCGVVGLKPSFGRIPCDGLIPLAPSYDHVGIFTSDLMGAAYAGMVLVDDWQLAAANPVPGARPRLAVPTDEAYLASLSEVGKAHFETVLALLESEGFDLVHCQAFEEFEAIRERHETLVAAEAARVHSKWFGRYRGRYDGRTVALIERGAMVPDSDLRALRAEREVLRSRLESILESEGLDLWLTPAAPGTAPEGLESTGDPVMSLPFTQAGLPMLTLPAGADEDDLPLGVQAVGRFGADEQLLAHAAALEALVATIEIEDPEASDAETSDAETSDDEASDDKARDAEADSNEDPH